MPTTTNGTAYTTTRIDLGAPHGVMNVTVADSQAGGTLRCLLYAHGAGGADNQFVALSAWKGLRDALLDDTLHPWVIVEGSGGAAVGSQNWGNPAAVAAYPAYLARARLDYTIDGVILLGRSMGGLVTANLCAHDTTGAYDGWINNSGVSTALLGGHDGSKGSTAATAWRFAPTMWDSWGVADIPGLQAAMAAADAIPEDWAASVWAGKKILNCYGDADTTVNWNLRGAGPLRTIWAGQPAIDRVAVRSGGDHTGGNGSYLQVADMLAFIADVFGDEPPDPPAPTFVEVAELHLLDPWGRRVPLYI